MENPPFSLTSHKSSTVKISTQQCISQPSERKCNHRFCYVYLWRGSDNKHLQREKERLTPRIQQEILSELRTPDQIRETLDVVDIVLGFLSTGGGKASRPLGEYIDRVLKMKRRRFSQKARDYCKLGHILSLWEILSVELAKLLYLRGEEPFDSVKEEFLQELQGEESGDDQRVALDRCLRGFDLDRLLGIMYEFIETHVKHSPDNEQYWPLVDTLEAFLQNADLPEGSRLAVDTLPDTIILAQAVATWKHVVTYQAGDKLK